MQGQNEQPANRISGIGGQREAVSRTTNFTETPLALVEHVSEDVDEAHAARNPLFAILPL